MFISDRLLPWSTNPFVSAKIRREVNEGDVYLSTGPQVVDDSLDSVHHLQSHLLLLRPRGDVVIEVIDLLV